MPKVENYLDLDLRGRTSGVLKLKCTLSPECINRKNKTDRSLYVNLDSRVYHCYNCNKKGSLDRYTKDKEYKEPAVKWHNLNSAALKFLNERGISERVAIRNRLQLANRYSHEAKANKDFIAFPYYNESGTKAVNYKYRAVDGKEFGQEANAMPLMYNLHEWAEFEEVVIVEGEIDVLSINEAEIWEVTSVNAGAINPNDDNVDGKLQCLYNSYEFFENKKRIILFCDKDPAGKRLEYEIATKLGTYRCYTVDVPEGYKDANEVLNGNKAKNLPALGKEALQRIIINAKPIPVSGVVYAEDIIDVMLYNYDNGKPKGATTHFPDIDNYIRWKMGNLNAWVGYANHGKTFLVLQMMLVKSMYDGWKWGVFSPENFPPEDFYDDLAEMYVGKHVDNRAGNKMTRDEYIEAMAFINEHIIFVYPEAAHTIDSVHNTFRGLIGKHGIKGVLIDPWNQLDHTQGGSRDDQYLSIQLNAIKRFALEYNIIYNIVVHPRGNLGTTSTGAMKIVDVYDLAQGAMWANKIDDAVSLYAPNWHENKSDTTRVFVKQKTKRKRTGGHNGECTIILDEKSMRYTELQSGKTPCNRYRATDYQEIVVDADKPAVQKTYTNYYETNKPDEDYF
jgi:twinkle protein